MMITAGVRLGPYEIVESLGAGGMGEVWRAKDTRLDRQVAIKVLPAGLSENEQLHGRFDREAKAISSLNHPNICTLHDVGHANGRHYLVMELIEGESLADRLDKGPLPLDEAIRYGIEITNALDRAHRQGIIHRDLKPGNVMVTSSGAKILDFGLAKMADRASESAPGTSNLPTQKRNLTEEGTILGTVQYMAPEQIEGHEADRRADRMQESRHRSWRDGSIAKRWAGSPRRSRLPWPSFLPHYGWRNRTSRDGFRVSPCSRLPG